MMTKKNTSRGPSKKHRSGPQTRLCWFIIRTTRIYGLWWVYTSNRRGPLTGSSSSTEIRNCSEIVHKKTLEEPIFRCRGTCPTIEVYFGHMFNPKTKKVLFSLFIVDNPLEADIFKTWIWAEIDFPAARPISGTRTIPDSIAVSVGLLFTACFKSLGLPSVS